MEVLRGIAQTKAFRYFLALIWLVNGLGCKVLGLVPRHEQIVAAILGIRHAHAFTLSIGLAESVMALWILSGWRYRLCALTQMAVIAVMNVMEFFAVPELLLWGRGNVIFAALLILLIHQSTVGPRPHH
ncbi:MAG: DoxX-like family protein [Flavobacteriales bacterium]|nr:DoxX-like family protein [Flavobacteriales bacterium]